MPRDDLAESEPPLTASKHELAEARRERHDPEPGQLPPDFEQHVLSEATVNAHVSRLLNKLEASNRVQIAILVHDAAQA